MWFKMKSLKKTGAWDRKLLLYMTQEMAGTEASSKAAKQLIPPGGVWD
jgi:hypothetical protein